MALAVVVWAVLFHWGEHAVLGALRSPVFASIVFAKLCVLCACSAGYSVYLTGGAALLALISSSVIIWISHIDPYPT